MRSQRVFGYVNLQSDDPDGHNPSTDTESTVV
jgi:hypothetical protein